MARVFSALAHLHKVYASRLRKQKVTEANDVDLRDIIPLVEVVIGRRKGQDPEEAADWPRGRA